MKKFLSLYLLVSSILFSQYHLEEKICDGVVFHKLELPGPVAIQYLEIDLKSNEISLRQAIANNYLGNGGETVSHFAERMISDGKEIVAAVNADFFGDDPHQVLNCNISGGKFVKGNNRNRSQFGLLNNNKPIIEKLKFKGFAFLRDTSITLSFLNYGFDKKNIVINHFANKLIEDDTLHNSILVKALTEDVPNDTISFIVEKIEKLVLEPELQSGRYYLSNLSDDILNRYISPKDTIKLFLGTDPEIKNIKFLTGGLPRLIVDGKAIEDFHGVEGLTSDKFIGKNPRTAVGFNRDSTKIYIVTVDGRQTHYSVGMTLNELADFLLGIGCYQAVNLDGGGSTTMWVNGKVENSPSDKTGERPVHNFLYIQKIR